MENYLPDRINHYRKCPTVRRPLGNTGRDSTCTSEDDDSNCVKYPTPDQRIFSGSKYENSYKWLYYSVEFELQLCFIYRENQVNTPADLLLKMENNEAMKNVFPNLFYLLCLANIIPTTTACVEQIFSLMNSLCTPLRNRLTEGSLDALIMRICAEGPVNLTNDNLEQIIDIFKAMKPRKLAL